MEPVALLLNEPTSALDPRTTGGILTVVRNLASAGQTMIVVRHAIGFARQVASRMAVLGDGRIVEEGGVADVLDRPRRAETRAFLAMEQERGNGNARLGPLPGTPRRARRRRLQPIGVPRPVAPL